MNDSTQPAGPHDFDHDPAESRGLGPVVKEEQQEPEEKWLPVPGTGGRIETNGAGQWRTNIPTKD